MFRCPGQGRSQLGLVFRLVQPALVVRDYVSGAYEPHPDFLLFYKHLLTGMLLAERNLAVNTYGFDGRL